MATWCYWVFGFTCLVFVCRILLLGGSKYPREKHRRHDCIDALFELGLIIWGCFAIFGAST